MSRAAKLIAAVAMRALVDHESSTTIALCHRRSFDRSPRTERCPLARRYTCSRRHGHRFSRSRAPDADDSLETVQLVKIRRAPARVTIHRYH